MDKDLPERWAARTRDAFHDSGLTLSQLGVRMGYPEDAAHRAAWDFLYRNPRPAPTGVLPVRPCGRGARPGAPRLTGRRASFARSPWRADGSRPT
jgi:hypothetical protein